MVVYIFPDWLISQQQRQLWVLTFWIGFCYFNKSTRLSQTCLNAINSTSDCEWVCPRVITLLFAPRSLGALVQKKKKLNLRLLPSRDSNSAGLEWGPWMQFFNKHLRRFWYTGSFGEVPAPLTVAITLQMCKHTPNNNSCLFIQLLLWARAYARDAEMSQIQSDSCFISFRPHRNTSMWWLAYAIFLTFYWKIRLWYRKREKRIKYMAQWVNKRLKHYCHLHLGQETELHTPVPVITCSFPPK